VNPSFGTTTGHADRFEFCGDGRMDPVLAMTIAEDLSMRYDITYKNWKCEEIKEDMFIEGQGFLHIDYDEDGTSRLRVN